MKTNDNRSVGRMIKVLEKRNENLVDIDTLIRKVKAEDEKNLRITKNFQLLYVIMVVVFALLMLFPDSSITLNKRISVAFYIASMTVFAYIFRKGYKEYISIDYSQSVIEMLRNAAKRYSLKQKNKFHLLSIPIILMDIGLTLSFYNDLGPLSPLGRVLTVQILYVPVMVVSALIGVLVWRKKQKPLHDNALELIKELEC